MITLEINNKNIEKVLYTKFGTTDKIKKYIYNLLSDDLMQQNKKKDGVFFLESVKDGLKDIQQGRTHNIDTLWNQLKKFDNYCLYKI
ncbi:MAG: hypothetical protein DRQ51_10095 [Gammaproteobacteria bacterium]|nr:MAG: hypothetical protein DRQ51_10095 [Gammaproteobacteria bacterium]